MQCFGKMEAEGRLIQCVCVCWGGNPRKFFSKNLDWAFRSGKYITRWLWSGMREVTGKGRGTPGPAEPRSGGGRAQLQGWVCRAHDREAVRTPSGKFAHWAKEFGFFL